MLVAARNHDVHGRIILDVAWVPSHGGEAKTAMNCFTRLAPLVPGAQGVIYDTALRGVHHQTLLRDLGLIPINRVTAAKAGSKQPRRSDGRRVEKSTRVERKTITLPDGTGRSVELYAKGGAVGIGELTERGDLHYTKFPRVRTQRQERPPIITLVTHGFSHRLSAARRASRAPSRARASRARRSRSTCATA